MKVMETVKQWVEQHAHIPSFPWSDTLWRSTSPQVRPTALDLTYEHLEEHEREVRETVGMLEAELRLLAQQRLVSRDRGVNGGVRERPADAP
jgi:hypothetical protein